MTRNTRNKAAGDAWSLLPRMLTCLPRPRYAELLTGDSSMHRGSMIRNHLRRITNICWNDNDNPTGGEVWKEDPNIEHLPDYFCWWLELLRRIPLLIIISPLIPQLNISCYR